MKIAYVYDAVYPWVKGGAEKRIYEISRRLAARGHEVHCYGMKYWPGQDDIEAEGVHLHGICPPRPLYCNGKRSITQAAYFAGRLLAIGTPREVRLQAGGAAAADMNSAFIAIVEQGRLKDAAKQEAGHAA